MKKKIIFFILTFLLVFITINLGSFILIKSITKKNIYTKDYKEFKKRFRKSNFKTIFPHPFFGFGIRDNYNYTKKFNNEPLFVNDINKINLDDKIKILILGGSVATHLSLNNSGDKYNYNNMLINHKDIFEKTINSYFGTDKFIVMNAAIGGGKQPQQLFKLYYLDLINFKFDIIINLDGFNELALPLSENYQINDHLIYPRNFSRLITTFNSNFDCVNDINKRTKRFLLFPILELYDLYKIRNCHFSLEGENKNTGTRFSNMTNFKKRDLEKSFKHVKEIWEKSSEKINDFSKLKNIFYIHVIQPNQYLKDSKKLTNKEIELLNYPKYGDIISKFYYSFNFENLNIKNKLDLKYIFKYNNSEIYRDYCCHLNNYGMHLISKEIVRKFELELKEMIKN